MPYNPYKPYPHAMPDPGMGNPSASVNYSERWGQPKRNIGLEALNYVAERGSSGIQGAIDAIDHAPPTQAYRQARIRGEQAMGSGESYAGGFAKGYGQGWMNAPDRNQYVDANEAPGGAAVELLEPVGLAVGALTGGLGKGAQAAVPVRNLAGSVGRIAAKPFQQYARRRGLAQAAPELSRALQGGRVAQQAGGTLSAEYGSGITTAAPKWLPKRGSYEILPYDPQQGYYPIVADTTEDLQALAYNLGRETQDGLKGFSRSQYARQRPNATPEWQYDVAAATEDALPSGTMTHEVAGHLPEHRLRGFGSDKMIREARSSFGGLADDMKNLDEVFSSTGAQLPQQYASRTPVERGREWLARYRAGQLDTGKIPWVENSPWWNPYQQAGDDLMRPMEQAIANRIQDRQTKQLAGEMGKRYAATQGGRSR